MIIETHEYTKIIAEDGYFLTNSNGVYGTSIILGENDSPDNYVELPSSEWPQEQEQENQTESEYTQEEILLSAKKTIKLQAIDAYDSSSEVNGFYYGGQLMWLDRETRASLKNTIESLSLIGRDYLDIWYETIHITLDLSSARYLLASLEVYATDCYNVTAAHKLAVSQMATIADVDNFDITQGYPAMLNFE